MEVLYKFQKEAHTFCFPGQTRWARQTRREISSSENGEEPVKKQEIPEKEKRERLRGCFTCPHKDSHTIVKDDGTSLQARVRTRVKCKVLDGQVVSPTKASEYQACERLKHVERKKFSPIHLAKRATKK